jgi:hypothetical protein
MRHRVGLPGCENGFVRMEDLWSTSSTPDKFWASTAHLRFALNRHNRQSKAQ